MASKVFETAFKIVGNLSSSFTQAFTNASKQLGKTSQELSRLNAEAGKITKLEKMRESILKSSQSFQQAKQKANELKKEIEASGVPTKKLTDAYNKAEASAKKWRDRTREQVKNFQDFRRESGLASVKVDDFKRKQDQLTESIKKQEATQKRLQQQTANTLAVQNKMAKASQAWGNVKSTAISTALTTGAAMYPIISSAIKTQDAQIKTELVLEVPDSQRKKVMEQIKQTAKKLADTGFVDYAGGYDIQTRLLSAGLDAQTAMKGASTIAKVAKVNIGEAGQTAEVMAMAFNNMKKLMTGDTESKFKKLGDSMTAVMVAYQIKDFNQFGESVAKGTSGISNFNVNLDQALTALGTLNNAGRQGTEAGMSLNAVLRQMGKLYAEGALKIVRNKNGQMDLIATLKEVRKNLKGLNTDQRAAVVNKLFGDEGAAGLIPLLDHLDELEAGYKQVASSQGVLDKKTKIFSESTSRITQVATNNFAEFAETVGTVVLPYVNQFLTKFSEVMQKFSAFSQQNPNTVSNILKIGGAILALNLGARTVIATWQTLSLIFSAGQWLISSISLITGLGKSISLVTIATKAWTAAQWLINAAMTANPIGLIIAGIAALAAGAYLVIRNWDTIKTWWAGLWGGMVKYIENINWLEVGKKVITTIATGISLPARMLYNAVDGVFKYVGKLLPHSDAEEGVFSRLTASGKAITETMAIGVKTSAPLGDVLAGKLAGGGNVSLATPLIKGGVGGEGISITFAPVQSFGAGTNKADIDRSNKQMLEDMKRLINDAMRDKKRLGLA